MWAGEKTPNLNGEKRFLRGGDASDLLKMESDQIENHWHAVQDNGHLHKYSWTEKGSHGGTGGSYTDVQKQRHDKDDPECKDENGHTMDTCPYKTTDSSKENSGVSVGDVSTGNHGSETRPINMSVLYIMRVY